MVDKGFNDAVLRDAREVARQIRAAFEVDKILLFGSGAREEARQSSDLDIIVVGRSKLSFKQRRQAVYAAVDPPRDTDILWYTPEELNRMVGSGNSFLRHALANARTLENTGLENTR